jgi:hypothetical protein
MTEPEERLPKRGKAEMPNSALAEDGLVAQVLGVVAPPPLRPVPPRPPQPRLADMAYVALVQICKGNSDDAGTYEADEELVRNALKRLNDLETSWAQALPLELLEIGQRLRTQDSRCTAHPIFQVRGIERIYGIDPDYCDDPVWIDIEDGAREVEAPEDEDNPPEYVIRTGYMDKEQIIMQSFTEEACNQYLESNRHRYSRRFRELFVYADSLYRCSEMIAIRNFLMSLPEPRS